MAEFMGKKEGTWLSDDGKQNPCFKVYRFVPCTFSETKPRVPMDLNVGFQGLALIQGQIYNPPVSAMKIRTV